MNPKTVFNLRSYKKGDIESAIADAYMAGVRAGIMGARGELKTEKALSTGLGVLQFPTTSILYEINSPVGVIISANTAAVMAQHKIQTADCFK